MDLTSRVYPSHLDGELPQGDHAGSVGGSIDDNIREVHRVSPDFTVVTGLGFANGVLDVVLGDRCTVWAPEVARRRPPAQSAQRAHSLAGHWRSMRYGQKAVESSGSKVQHCEDCDGKLLGLRARRGEVSGYAAIQCLVGKLMSMVVVVRSRFLSYWSQTLYALKAVKSLVAVSEVVAILTSHGSSFWHP